MSGAASIVEKAVEFAYRHFTATQVCWLCLTATTAGGWFFATHYARAGDLLAVRAELVEMKGDTIAKRIFDYRVRQCDTPPEQRQAKQWLAEQIRSDVEKYAGVTGKPFALPACGDL
jgi:hypothetical protein